MSGRGGTGLARRARGRPAAGRLLPPRLYAAGRDRPDRLTEQGGRLRSAVPHGRRDAAHHSRRSQASGCPHWRNRGTPYLGFGNDLPPARPYDCAGRRDLAGWHALDLVPTRLSVTGTGALAPVPAALPGRPRRRSCGGPAGLLRRDRKPARSEGLRCPSRAAAAEELVRLCQAALRRARGGARLPRPLYPPRRHSEQPAGPPRRKRRHLSLKDYRRDGQARYRTMTLAAHEFIRRFLLHVLPRGFHRIRHYGLLASATCKANIARARELIAAPEPLMEPATARDTKADGA